MRFSILIPVYNTEKYLRTCIESVLSQEYYSYEIIFIDDGSEDSSGVICDEYLKKYPKKIRCVHQKNVGLFKTRRRLFDMANGEYCLCLDSDDYLEKNSLNVLSQIIETCNPDFVLYNLFNFYDGLNNKKDKTNCPLIPNMLYKDLNILKKSLLDLSFSNWSLCAKCIKRSIINDSFDFSDYYSISYGEDTLQSIVLYNKSNNYYYCDEKIYNYRIGTGMTKKPPIKYLEDFFLISNIMPILCKDWSLDIEKSVDYYISKICINYIVVLIRSSFDIKDMVRNLQTTKKFLVEKNFDINYNIINNRVKRFVLKNRLYVLLYIIYVLKGYKY